MNGIVKTVQSAQLFNLQEVYIMSDFTKDVFTGLIFLIGILGFISGEFIVSSTLFAASAISSNVLMTRRLAGK
jgi:CheY-specific phosphatase CheX